MKPVLPEPFAIGQVVTFKPTGEAWQVSQVEGRKRPLVWLYRVKGPGTMTVPFDYLTENFVP